MSTPSETGLLELAERCEKATGPDRELDATICRAVGPAREQPDGSWMVYFEDGYRHSLHPPELTASLDAAMTLVPETCLWTMDSWSGTGWSAGVWFPRARRWIVNTDKDRQSHSPALALCAAALRAHHAEQSK